MTSTGAGMMSWGKLTWSRPRCRQSPKTRSLSRIQTDLGMPKESWSSPANGRS